MVKTERRNMTVKYYVEILYLDEYIVDFMDEMNVEYIQECYPATYDSPAEYDFEIESDVVDDIMESIMSETIYKLEYEIGNGDDKDTIVKLLEDEIEGAMDEFDFDADTEILTLKISIEYDGNR